MLPDYDVITDGDTQRELKIFWNKAHSWWNIGRLKNTARKLLQIYFGEM